MNAGREQWIMFCLDDFRGDMLDDHSGLLQELVASDYFSREKLLNKISFKERESLFKEVLFLERQKLA